MDGCKEELQHELALARLVGKQLETAALYLEHVVFGHDDETLFENEDLDACYALWLALDNGGRQALRRYMGKLEDKLEALDDEGETEEAEKADV